MLKIVDLRSDTITRPSAAMRERMAYAEVGDDVYDDDPTVNLLQERCANLLGKQAALFVPSGTMGNAIAIKTHTVAGDEILLDGEAHSMVYELGLPGALAGVLTRPFPSKGGIPLLDGFEACIHKESLHNPATTLIVLENTHNRAGGVVIPIEVHQQIRLLAQPHNIKIHLDGARLFNAAIAAGIPVREFAAEVDSVTFCLSKGLGCPIGSVLCGDAAFIARAKRFRKMLGGGMRQVGILAAAGLYALDNNIDRLSEDHANATRLAGGLNGLPGITVDTVTPPTNMVYINTVRPASEISAKLAQEHRILANPWASHRMRLVTHLDVDAADIDRSIDAIRQAAAN